VELDEGIEKGRRDRSNGGCSDCQIAKRPEFWAERRVTKIPNATSTPGVWYARIVTYLLILWVGSLRIPRSGSCHGEGIIFGEGQIKLHGVTAPLLKRFHSGLSTVLRGILRLRRKEEFVVKKCERANTQSRKGFCMIES
jgi:hypothetical protein